MNYSLAATNISYGITVTIELLGPKKNDHGSIRYFSWHQ